MSQVYKVLRIVELVRPGDTGGVEKYYRHTIKTRGGTVLTVDVNKSDFTKAKAGPILAAEAQAADEILTS